MCLLLMKKYIICVTDKLFDYQYNEYIMSEDLQHYTQDDKLKDNEKRFLEEYEDSYDIMESARRSGLDTVNIHRRLKSSSTLGKHFKKLIFDIDKDHRYGKAGSITMLMKLKKLAEDKEDYNLVFKIIQEINKMIDGNIAVQKKVVENRQFEIKGVIDLTKPIEEPKTIDISYEEA